MPKDQTQISSKLESIFRITEPLALFATMLLLAASTQAKDWPMLGRDRTRNPVSPEKGAPVDWDAKTGRNIKWKAQLGSVTVSEPVLAGGLIWIGTNNDSPRDS